MDLQRLIWGESPEQPTVPLYYPLLALLPVVSSLTVTTWFLPRELGYFITATSLAVVALYGVLAYTIRDTDIPLQVSTPFFILLGGYWTGLVVHYSHSPHIEILQYILVTPLAVFTTVVILPALIDGRRQVFTMGITLITVVSSLIGIVVLWQEPSELSRYIGSPVLGIGNLRTTSIFHNPNTYGFFMMAGSLAALYTYLTRRGAVWLGALGLCLLGLFMSGGDAAFVGFVAGAVLVLSGPDYRFGFFGLLFAVVGVYIAIQLGHVTDVMEGTLMQRVDRWVASLERLAQNPLLGIGFANTASQIGEEIGPHNSYIYPLLNTGIIAGGFYLGALIYALGQGLRTWWTPWTGFVVGLTVAIFLYMGFESLFLGGLSVSSILLGLSLGLLLYSSETRHSWLGTQNR